LTRRITIAAISIAFTEAFTFVTTSKLGVAAVVKAFDATGCTRSYFIATKLFMAAE
jgi:uncharacterized membrane protein